MIRSLWRDLGFQGRFVFLYLCFHFFGLSFYCAPFCYSMVPLVTVADHVALKHVTKARGY